MSCPRSINPPVYNRKDGSCYARVWRDGRPKDYRLGKAGSPEAQAKYAALCSELAKSPHHPLPAGASAAGVTVAEVAAHWTLAAPNEYPPTSGEPQQFRYAIAPLVALYGSTLARAFDAAALERVVEAMASGAWIAADPAAVDRAAAQPNRPAGWTRGVVARRLGRIRTLWRWAERRKLVPAGSWAALLVVRPPRKGRAREAATRQRSATWEQVQAIASKAPAPAAALIQLQWLTGMRSGEVRTMRLVDIDRETGPLVDGLRVWLYRPQSHKGAWRENDAGRVIPLGGRCQEVLGPWLAAALGDATAAGDPTAPLFRPCHRHRQSRTCYSDTGYAQAIRRAAVLVGLPWFHPYVCRHAAKTRFKRDAGLDAARAMLGQQSVNTTELYGDQDLEAAARIAAKYA